MRFNGCSLQRIHLLRTTGGAWLGRLGSLWQAAHLPSPPLALGDWLPILALLIGLGKELRVRVGIASYQPYPDGTPRQGSVTSELLM